MNQLVEVIAGGVFTLLGIVVKEWYQKKLENKKKPDLSDVETDELVQPIVDIIQEEFNAHRVAFWEASNGTHTLSGHSIKKLSMIAESNATGVESVKHEMQMMSVSTFKRNIDLLRHSSRDYIISYESEKNDELAAYHMAYGMQTMLAFKIFVREKFVGILIVGFDEPKKHFSHSDLAWLNAQAKRIGTILAK